MAPNDPRGDVSRPVPGYWAPDDDDPDEDDELSDADDDEEGAEG